MNERDWLIAEMAASGKTNAEIAVAIDRSHATVLLRMKHIYKAFGINGNFGTKKRRHLARELADAKTRAGRA